MDTAPLTAAAYGDYSPASPVYEPMHASPVAEKKIKKKTKSKHRSRPQSAALLAVLTDDEARKKFINTINHAWDTGRPIVVQPGDERRSLFATIHKTHKSLDANMASFLKTHEIRGCTMRLVYTSGVRADEVSNVTVEHKLDLQSYFIADYEGADHMGVGDSHLLFKEDLVYDTAKTKGRIETVKTESGYCDKLAVDVEGFVIVPKETTE